MSEYNIIDLYKLKTESKGFHERHIIRGAIEEIQTLRTKLERHARQAPASGEVEPGSRKEFWQNLERFADDYINGYEFRGDDGDYSPNEKEQFLIEDCVAGLLHEMDNEGYLSTHPPAKVPEGFVLAERHFTPEYVIEAGTECLRALEKAGCNDTRTIAQVVYQDMLLAIERNTTPTPDTTAQPAQQGVPEFECWNRRFCDE